MEEVVEETVVEEAVVEEEVVLEEDALDEMVEEATEAVAAELSPIAWNAVRRHDPPHFEYISPAQATLQSVDATSLAVDL